MFTICAICPADHLKATKIRIAEAVSSLFAILRFLLYLKFGPVNFLKTGSRKDRNVFNDLANLRIFHRRKRNKYCSKDPYFVCCKTLHNGIEVRQDLYLSVRTLSKLSPLAIFLIVFTVWLTSFSGVEGL